VVGAGVCKRGEGKEVGRRLRRGEIVSGKEDEGRMPFPSVLAQRDDALSERPSELPLCRLGHGFKI